MIPKYRIYDKENNEYCEEPDHRWMLSRNGRLYNSKNDKFHIIGERFLVEFFTGKIDKNSAEIYDGSIVRILYTDWGSKLEEDPRTLEQYLIDISKIGVVEFNDNAWEVKMYSKKYDDYGYSSISPGKYGYIEVIGNIHENKDLL